MTDEGLGSSSGGSNELPRSEIIKEFKAALQRGEIPDLEQWLSHASVSERAALRTELERILMQFDITEQQLPGELLPSEVAGSSSVPKEEGEERDECVLNLGAKVGKYVVEELVGGGAFGNVYCARDTVLDRKVAIKVPSKACFQSREAFQLYVREARSIAQVDHDRIVPIYDHGELLDGQVFYLVLKYIDGPSLASFLASQRPSAERCVDIVKEVSEAVAAIHQAGFWHRDLKPANILLDGSGKPYVTDFGLAIHENEQGQRRGELAGTWPYMSPEQVRGKADLLDGRSDIWATGVILYEMLSGHLPFQSKSEILHREPVPISQRVPDVDPRLEEICVKCLAKEPAERYSSASSLAKDLNDYLELASRDLLEISYLDDHRVRVGDITIVLPRAVEQEPQIAAKSREDHGLGANPYRGLGAFQEQDAHLFFGREDQIDRLYDSLCDFYQGHDEKRIRLLPILGPSGCGKSSLARAGLVARLAKQPLSDGKSAQVLVLTPDVHPLESLANMLARAVTNDPTPASKSEEFLELLRTPQSDNRYDGLRRIASMFPDRARSRLVLLIDQFEEVYTLCADEAERTAFIENLLGSSRDKSGDVSVILTLRSDFLGETQEHPTFNEVVCSQNVIVPTMSDDDLRRAITEPARQTGYRFDRAMVDLLMRDTRDREGALPLLQFALTRIWEGLERGVDAHATLEQIGGVGGALAGEAQRIYLSLEPEDQRIVRRAFQSMVQLGEGTQDTRRRITLDEVIAVGDETQRVHDVLSRFAERNCRLVTLLSGDSVDLAEVTHESLFEHWEVLREWVDQNREAIRLRQRLEEATRHWEGLGRPSGLLWRSPDLDLLAQFCDEFSADLTARQLEFYRESMRQQNRGKQLNRLAVGLFCTMVVAIAGLTVMLLHSRYMQLASQLSERERELATTYVDTLNRAFSDCDVPTIEAALRDLRIISNAEAEQARSVLAIRAEDRSRMLLTNLQPYAESREIDTIRDYIHLLRGLLRSPEAADKIEKLLDRRLPKTTAWTLESPFDGLREMFSEDAVSSLRTSGTDSGDSAVLHPEKPGLFVTNLPSHGDVTVSLDIKIPVGNQAFDVAIVLGSSDTTTPYALHVERRPDWKRSYVTLRQGKDTIRELAVLHKQLSKSLHLFVERDSRALKCRVNDFLPLVYHDLFPINKAPGALALRLSSGTEIAKMHVTQSRPPEVTTVIEEADSHFLSGEYELARTIYSARAVRDASNDALDDIGDARECRVKEALCLLARGGQDEKAARILKDVVTGDDGWALVAAAQLFALSQKRVDLEQEDVFFAKMLEYPEEELVTIPDRIWGQIGQYYFINPVTPGEAARLESRHVEELKFVAAIQDRRHSPWPVRLALRSKLAEAFVVLDENERALQEMYELDMEVNLQWPRYKFLDFGRAELVYYWTWAAIRSGRPDDARSPIRRNLSMIEPKYQRMVLLDRARMYLALNEAERALTDVESVLDALSANSQHMEEIGTFAAACLFKGFVLERDGMDKEAVDVWRQAYLVCRDARREKKISNLALIPIYQLGSLSGEITEEDANQMFADAAAETSPWLLPIVDVLNVFRPKEIVLAMNAVWSCEPGRSYARDTSFRTIGYREALAIQIPLALYQVARIAAFSEKFTPDQEELVWEMTQEGMRAYQEGELGNQHLLPILMSWLTGDTSPLGLQGIRPYLSPIQQDRFDYVLGHRYAQTGKIQPAIERFTCAAESEDETIRDLARTELERLKTGETTTEDE